MNNTSIAMVAIFAAALATALIRLVFERTQTRRDIERHQGRRREKNLRKHIIKEPGLWRGFLTYKDPDYRRKGFDLQLEIAHGRKSHFMGPGFRIHFGDRGSETPFHINLYLYWVSFYFSMNTPNMGAIFSKICGGHKRDISIETHSGKLWWKMWYDDDGGHDSHHKCDKIRKIWWWPFKNHMYRSWACFRDGNIDLNPIDAMWGPRYYHYEKLATEDDLVGLYEWPDDVYNVTFTLMKVTRARRAGPKWARRPKNDGFSVEWECHENTGIPFRNNSWKGDGVYGSAVKIDGDNGWLGKAEANLMKWITDQRKENGFKPPIGAIEEIVMTDEGLMVHGSVWAQDTIDKIKGESMHLSMGFNAAGEAGKKAGAAMTEAMFVVQDDDDDEPIDLTENELLKAMYTPEEILLQAENRDKED